MSTLSNLWRKLAKSKKYREEFVAAHVKRSIPFQARAMLKERDGWTQETLAEKSGLTQGVISRALNPNYGNLTLNTIIRMAAGFDVAFVGKFVPFSDLEKEFNSMSEDSGHVANFEEENSRLQQCGEVGLGETDSAYGGAAQQAMGAPNDREELGKPPKWAELVERQVA